MPDFLENALLIFIKNPKKGHVKTRLATSVGEEQALQIYQKLLQYTRNIAMEIPADRILWYSQSVQQNDEWNAESFIKRKQQGSTLGERMKYAFSQAFDEGYGKVVIIGSDCGQLEAQHIRQAYQALDYHDMVVGPSQDGGYYLLGMSRFMPELFEDKSWSTDELLQQTLQTCMANDVRYFLLKELNDVDTEEDWQQVQDRFDL